MTSNKRWIVALEFTQDIDPDHPERGAVFSKLVEFKTLQEAYSFYIKSLTANNFTNARLFKEVNPVVVEKPGD